MHGVLCAVQIRIYLYVVCCMYTSNCHPTGESVSKSFGQCLYCNRHHLVFDSTIMGAHTLFSLSMLRPDISLAPCVCKCICGICESQQIRHILVRLAINSARDICICGAHFLPPSLSPRYGRRTHTNTCGAHTHTQTRAYI